MEYLLFIFIILAGYHLFMEHVMIPAWELSIKQKIIELNEQLIQEYYKTKNKNLQGVLVDINQAIVYTCYSIDKHNIFDFWLYRKQMTVGKRKRIEKETEQRQEILNKYGNENINNIINEYGHQISKVFMVNMSGWLLYILPIVLIYHLFGSLFRSLKSQVNKTFAVRPQKISEYIEYEHLKPVTIPNKNGHSIKHLSVC